MQAKIYSVESVCFNFCGSESKSLIVSARGLVRTSGWTNGRLVPYVYVTPPSDGIQEFDFIANAPSGMVLQALEPICAMGGVVQEDWMQGVRIYAVTNNIEKSLDDAECVVDIGIIESPKISSIPEYFPW